VTVPDGDRARDSILGRGGDGLAATAATGDVGRRTPALTRRDDPLPAWDDASPGRVIPAGAGVTRRLVSAGSDRRISRRTHLGDLIETR